VLTNQFRSVTEPFPPPKWLM